MKKRKMHSVSVFRDQWEIAVKISSSLKIRCASYLSEEIFYFSEMTDLNKFMVAMMDELAIKKQE